MSEWINEELFSKYYKNKLLLISHGGVGSEYMTSLLNIYHTKDINPNSNKPIKGGCVHFPYPPTKFKLDKIIYIYGDIYNAIMSQISRHPDNASKLCNNMKYQHFHNLNEFFDCKNLDPFNIEKQINNYFTNQIEYPIILLKYNFDESLIPILIKITKNINFKYYKYKKRNDNFAGLSTNQQIQFKNIYGKLNNIIKHQPDLVIRFPEKNYKVSMNDVINSVKNKYKLSMNDVIKYSVKNTFPGKRIKHYAKINGYEIYNERECNYEKNTINYGAIRLKKPNEKDFTIYDFTKFNINIKRNFGGVEDPRYFVYKDNTYILMNGLDNNIKRNMYLYNIEKNYFCKLYISNYDITKIDQQKNWTPYINNDKIYFIYSFFELCVLELVDIEKGECLCIKGHPEKILEETISHKSCYGSTPLIQWNYPNFIGFVHKRLPYYSVPIIFDVESLEIKYLGEKIVFDNPENVKPWRGLIVQFPYNLTVDKNEIILSIEFEDKCPTLIYLDYINFCKAFSL